jgi:hypothetical protein
VPASRSPWPDPHALARQRAEEGARLVLRGVFANCGLAAAKFAGGILGNSYALIADGIESLLDICSSVLVWAGFRSEQIAMSGTPKRRQSSPHITRAFCPDCGTPMTYEDERLQGEIYIHAGLFDEADRLVPIENYDVQWYSTSIPLRLPSRNSPNAPLAHALGPEACPWASS